MSLGAHVWQSLLFLALAAGGPLPACLALARGAEEARGDGSAFAARALAWVTGWCALQAALAVALGALGRFNLSAVLVGEGLLFLGGVVWLWLTRRQERPVVADAPPLDAAEWTVLTALGLLAGLLLYHVGTRPIVEYDSLAYHLPAMALWLQDGAFTGLEQYAADQVGRYPYSWEALCALMMLPFGNDVLAALPNGLSWIALGLAIHLLAVRLGAGRLHGLLAAALALTMPLVLEHVNTLHVDLPFAACFAIGLFYAAEYGRARRPANLLLFCLALGLLVGIKMTGLIYGALLVGALCVILVWRCWFQRLPAVELERPVLFWHGALAAAGGLAFVLLVGGFWYLRNMRETAGGNPLGYYPFSLWGLIEFSGPLDRAELRKGALAVAFELGDFSHWRIWLGQVWEKLRFSGAALALLAAFLAPAGVMKLIWRVNLGAENLEAEAGGQARKSNRRFSRQSPLALWGLLAVLAITFGLYWFTPYSADNGYNDYQITPWLGGQLRFAFPFFALLAVAGAVGASAVGVRRELAAMLAVSACALALPRLELLDKAVILLVLGGAAWGVAPRERLRGWWTRGDQRARASALLAAALALLLVAGYAVRCKRDTYYDQKYGLAFNYLEHEVKQGEAVGYLLCQASYPLYGRDLRRRVHYVAAGADQDFRGWLEELRRREVRFVAVGPLGDILPETKELQWLRESGEFERIAGQEPKRETVLFRLKRR